MSWFGKISETYAGLWKLIIRPPRDKYHVEELGPQRFRIGSAQYERVDFQLQNERGMKLECSHYRPRSSGYAESHERLPCVIYLHGNCSSRVEACEAVPLLLPKGVTLLSLDFAGSGHSEGDYISLGHWEEQDLRVVIDHLRGPGRASAIGLWGRSMGAATSVLRAAQDPALAACVMDSPFGSLKQVAEELVCGGSVPIPTFLLSMALGVVGSEVRSRADFDLTELCPARAARFAVAPALFGVASDDNFVLPHHTKDIYDAWGGVDKSVVTFTGGHNGQRPEFFRDRVVKFLIDRLAKAQTDEFLSQTMARAKQLRTEVEKDERDAAEDITWKSAVPASLTKLPVPQASGSSGPPTGRSAEMVAELVAMGFDNHSALEAMRRTSSVEAAVEWIMQQSIEAFDKVGNVELRAPDRCGHGLGGQSAATPKAADTPPAAAEEHIPATGVGGEQLAEQLVQIGILPADAAEAARRCSSVEAAMEWLIANGKM